MLDSEKIKLKRLFHSKVLFVIFIFFIYFALQIIYFRQLYIKGDLINLSNSSKYLSQILIQHLVVNSPMIIILFVYLLKYKSKALEKFSLNIKNKSTKIILICLFIVYLASLIRQIMIYKDYTTIVFKWFYYFFIVAFIEEFEFRAFIPYFLDGCNKYIQLILPNVLFAFAHSMLLFVFGKPIIEIIGASLYNLIGYTIVGIFFELAKRKSGSLWVPVFIHSILDFGL